MQRIISFEGQPVKLYISICKKKKEKRKKKKTSVKSTKSYPTKEIFVIAIKVNLEM